MYRLQRVRVLNLEFRVLNLEFFLPLSSVVGGGGLFAGRTSLFRWLNRCDLSTESPRPACWIFVPLPSLALHLKCNAKVLKKQGPYKLNAEIDTQKDTPPFSAHVAVTALQCYSSRKAISYPEKNYYIYIYIYIYINIELFFDFWSTCFATVTL